MTGRYSEADRLARLANRFCGPAVAGLPRLLALTDPVRTPDPVAFARQLPVGSGLIYRHFGDPDRADVAYELADIAKARSLTLLISADAQLANHVGADGVHWPVKRALKARIARWRTRFPIMTASAHGLRDLRRLEDIGIDAALLSPVFSTRSHPDARTLGPIRARLLIAATPLPVYALGGIDHQTARRLDRSGFSGIAAIGGLAG